MRYVLILFWSFHGNTMDTRPSVDVITYATQSDCMQVGLRWLRTDTPGDIQRRHAFTCQEGGTSYELGPEPIQGRSR